MSASKVTEPREAARPATLRFTGESGLSLTADSYGPPDGEPVILLGGMGQIRQSWRRVAQQLAAAGRRAVTLDLRGHGESAWSPTTDYTYTALVGDLQSVVRSLGRPAVLVGASLGGKTSLAAAGYGGPEIASGLVMVDTAPRTNPAGVGAVMQSLSTPAEGFASLDAAAEALARHRDVAIAPGAGERLRRNMRQDAAGRWRWHWDPAFVDRKQGLKPADSIDYLEDAARRMTTPVLLARGELSTVVDDGGVAALRACIPQLEVEVTPGAGHMIVGDQNDRFAEGLHRFLARHPDI